MVSQGYDGASVMSGCISGVQKRIRHLVPQACYIHCSVVVITLTIVIITTQLQIPKSVIITITITN